MMNHFPKFLKLSEDETKILEILKIKGSLSVVEISKLLKKPRMTIYTPLKSLGDRGLISSHKKSKNNIISSNTDILEASNSMKIPHIIIGLENIVSLYLNFSIFSKSERVKWIQSNESMLAALQNVGLENIKQLNKNIFKNRNIIEALLESGYINVYRKFVGEEIFSKMAGSLYGRPYDVSYIPSRILDPHTEILITKEKAQVINWKDEIAYIYETPGMIDFYEKLFDVYKQKSNKFDVSRELKKNIL